MDRERHEQEQQHHENIGHQVGQYEIGNHRDHHVDDEEHHGDARKHLRPGKGPVHGVTDEIAHRFKPPLRQQWLPPNAALQR